MTRIALKHMYGTGGTGISSDNTGIFKLNLEKVKKEFSKQLPSLGLELATSWLLAWCSYQLRHECSSYRMPPPLLILSCIEKFAKAKK